ncbi:MAG: hypothetical protein ACTHN8_14020 [Angustibacter sp.]
MLDHARAEGDELVRRARQEADEAISRAEAEARRMADRAAADGQAEAAAALNTEQARSRRRARGVVLAAQAKAFAALREQVRREVASLTDDPRWAQRRAAMEHLARQALGPDAASAHADPLPDGVRVSSGSRSITLTVADLADAAVDGLGSDVESLWRP